MGKKQDEEDTSKEKEECEQEMMLDDKAERKKGREVLKEEFIQETISPAKVFMCREKKAKDDDDDDVEDEDEVEVIESEEEIIEEVMDVDNVEEVLIDDDE